MKASKVAGAVIFFLGAACAAYPVSGPAQNRDIALSAVGLIVAVFGGVVAAPAFFSERFRTRRLGTLISTAGWCLAAAGGAFFLVGGSQLGLLCSCPPIGHCECGDPILKSMFAEGMLIAIAGVAIVVSGLMVERELPAATTPPPPVQGPFRGRRAALLAVALTALLLFSVLDYYPGNYVEGVFESTQFTGGMPDTSPSHPFIISSSTPQPVGWHFIGSSITYSLTFDSVPSFPNYRITSLSAGGGFAVAGMNATVPLVVSPANPSVTVTLNIRGPIYPFYGSVPILLSIQKLNET